jgi:2-amino-4-hydroxy-6-hydroxymethyldihydropteridine diphosphokinase
MANLPSPAAMTVRSKVLRAEQARAAVAPGAVAVLRVPAPSAHQSDPLMPNRPARAPVTALVALGGNLGDARRSVVQALGALAALPMTRLVQASRLYRTAPYQAQGPDFINAVARLETCLTAPALLRELQRLENEAGRVRPYPNAPRTLDLDVLMYGDATMHSPSLTLPHPRWQERAFVVRPLQDVAPERVDEALLAGVAGQAIQRLE